MQSRSFFVAFLTLAISAFTAQAAPSNYYNNFNNEQACSVSVQTVHHTVTVTASSATSTSSSNSNSNSNSSSNSGSSSNSSSSSNNSSSSSSSNNSSGSSSSNHSSSSSSSGHSSSSSTSNNSSSGKNNHSKGNSSSSSSSTSTTTTVDSSSTTTAATAVNTNAASTNTTSTNTSGDDAAQTSLTLDPRVIATGFADDGQDVPEAGQVPSLTSTNNFINFCLTVPDLPITNGKQITTGSCNPAPIGVIPSTDNMPSAKFSFPTNFGTIKANTAFTITMNIQNMETGFFVNAQENYFAAPQQLNAQGQIQGHSHVVVEQIASLDQTTPTDPQKFAFFKGLNAAAANGQLTADVTAGLPAGVYRLASINTSANHAPVIVPVAQHGSLDDAIYFTVTDDGNPVGGAASAAATSDAASATTTSDAVSATASATDSVSATASDSASVAASTGTSVSVTGTTSGVASETASASATDSASATSVAATATATASSSSKNSKKNKSDKNSSAAASTDAAATSTATSSSSAASASATAKEASPKKARSLKYRRRNF